MSTHPLRALACAVVALAALPAAAGAAAKFPASSCPRYGDLRVCTAQVPSFDGPPLDADLTLPAGKAPAGGGHPLIVLLHGFAGDKHDWESTDDVADGGDKWHWNSHWFAQRGYTALTPPLAAPLETVGLGEVRIPYALAPAVETEVAARVWDVAPDGTALLVTRGVARLDPPAYDGATGELRLGLFGNHWLVPAGHRLRVDLAQADEPAFRHPNLPATLSFGSAELLLPAR
jgi:predicted acyl esterase